MLEPLRRGGALPPSSVVDRVSHPSPSVVKRSGKRVALLHHIGGGNLGDDATLQTAIANIRTRWSQADVIALSLNPEDSRTRHAIEAYPARDRTWSFGYTSEQRAPSLKSRVKKVVKRVPHVYPFLELLAGVCVRAPLDAFREARFLVRSFRLIRTCDVLVICGGGQLTEWGGPWGFPYTIFKWVLLARVAAVNCVFLNVGAGPLTHSISRFFIRYALRWAHHVSFRDADSGALAASLGFKGSRNVCPDIAYSLVVTASTDTAPPTSRGRHVGLAPMPYLDPRTFPGGADQRAYHNYVEKFAGFASWLMTHSFSVDLFGTDIGVDPLAISDVDALVRRNGTVESQDYRQSENIRSVAELLSCISKMDYVVTCRFHGVVFAHLMNKPVLAIAHHPKVTTLMRDLGLSRYCLDINTFDTSLLADTFDLLVSDSTKVRRQMANMLVQYRHTLVCQFDRLFPPVQPLCE